MTTPRTRSTLAAVKAEATASTIPFDYEGDTYAVLATSEWPFEALVAFEDGKIATFVRSILPTEDYARFLATKPRVADLTAVVEAIQGALGISGN